MKKTYVLLAIALIGGSVAIALIGNHMGLTKDSWPGWVQAIGSIAALGVAIFVMSQQNKHAAKLLVDADKRASLRRAHAAAAIIDRADSQVKRACQFIAVSLAVGNASNILSTITTTKFLILESQSAVRIIPTHELGSDKMISGLHRIIGILVAFDKGLEMWLGQTPLASSEDINAFLMMTIMQLDDAKTEFSQGIEVLRNE